MGPAASASPGPLLDPGLSEDRHWAASAGIRHPSSLAPPLEPGWARLLALKRDRALDIVGLRTAVVAQVREMVSDWEFATDAWLAAAPEPVWRTCATPDRDFVTQVPVLLQLLTEAGYPDVAGLEQDFYYGFDMLGPLRPGPGWRPRNDDRYSHPSSLETFRRANFEYVASKLRHFTPGHHGDVLLQEVLEEARLGRIVGPVRAPAWWPGRSVALPSYPDFAELVDPPSGDLFAAAAFAIVQPDGAGGTKVRRGEDWRRSSHNATVAADDVPTHHSVQDFATVANHLLREGDRPLVLGHDLHAAYRQFPVKVPGHSGMLLATPDGPTLWLHMAMCFGAAASVWNFNRAADALQQLLRVLLLIAAGHFVDDFTAIEDILSAASAVKSFEELFGLLGLRVKPSKAQPPNDRHVVQGVLFRIVHDGVVLSPTEERVATIRATVTTALETNSMAPSVAEKLAGRLAFLTQAVFGKLGRAAIVPIYARAHDQSLDAACVLNTGLAAALRSVVGILDLVRPKFVPASPAPAVFAVIYADAFYLEGETPVKAGNIQPSMRASRRSRASNGWGFVVRLGDRVFYDHGVVDAATLEAFASRKAFIYMLEVLAQIIAQVVLARFLPPAFVAFVDNEAGKFALNKGYGRDPAVNGLLAMYWCLAADFGWDPHFERVPSKANVSDAVSREDFSRAIAEGWTRLHTPARRIYEIAREAATSLDFAIGTAAGELREAALSSLP